MSVLTEIVLPRLEGIRPVAGGFQARCPAHSDKNPSLSLAEGKEQPVVIHCHAGCEIDAILAAIDLTWAELCTPRDKPVDDWTPRGPAVAIYDYRDEDNRLLFQVCRTTDKQFPQRVPDTTTKSGWRWTLGDVRRVLYRLPRLVEDIGNGQTVWITEGEKDADNLRRKGVAATTAPGGAGKWRPEYSEVLTGVPVVIVADKDRPGQAHARLIAQSLTDAESVRIVEAAAGKDASDHLAAGRSLDEFVTTWQSDKPTTVDLAPDLHEFLAIEDVAETWVIPGLLERGDRLIFTGHEGLGKSVAIRQIALTAAAGLHPFTNKPIPPQRVLVIDCENSARQSRPHMRRLERIARLNGLRVGDGQMFLIHKPAGIDLAGEDAAWLLERVTAHKPDLLVVGPLYRLHTSDINDERAARAVVSALDAARVAADCALITEAHAGHASGENGRGLRPAGSSLFLRWPEFGMGMRPKDRTADLEDAMREVVLRAWRGARSERSWPTELVRNADPNGWPWVDPNAAHLRSVPTFVPDSYGDDWPAVPPPGATA